MTNPLLHASVHSVVQRGIFVSIPRILGNSPMGPCLTRVDGLQEGDRVVVGVIGDQLADLIILARVGVPEASTGAGALDGGSASSTYLADQRFDGGTA